jgi:hypothetical protein
MYQSLIHECDTHCLSPYIIDLKKNIMQPEIFSATSIANFSENDFIIMFWRYIFETLFMQTGANPMRYLRNNFILLHQCLLLCRFNKSKENKKALLRYCPTKKKLKPSRQNTMAPLFYPPPRPPSLFQKKINNWLIYILYLLFIIN